ncbi:MAG: hypothetical protein IJX62_04125 [Clostridia bacterium]|nr:hypothetical protein [Clostridia bacterium]
MKRSGYRPKIPFRQRLYQFMYGRNGSDTLSNATAIAALVLLILEMIAGWWWLYFLSLALLIYSNFRVFSRNLAKRRAENAAFCRLWRKIKGFFSLQKNKWKDRKTHVYHKCPRCKSTLRLPRAKGHHTVNCPRCHQRFEMDCK